MMVPISVLVYKAKKGHRKSYGQWDFLGNGRRLAVLLYGGRIFISFLYLQR